MDIQNLSLGFDERIVFSLRELYEQYGYSHYRMSKFEEYDLYARNKDFLISDSVITFTDMDGRLLALKPDVTLSIVKNLKEPEGTTSKLYYNENVYRVTKGNRSFKEIMQTGLEAFGVIDDYTLCEVLGLAVDSLSLISQDCVLDVSNLDLLSAVIESLGLSSEDGASFMRLVGEKNIHELENLLASAKVSQDKVYLVSKLISTGGNAGEVLPKIEALLENLCDKAPLLQLKNIISALSEEQQKRIRIDFSVVDNTKYYNGLVFKGFIKGVPTAVLSGGQYSRLMKRLGRECDAVGFAVYHDTLERLYDEQDEFDVDALVVYGDKNPAEVREAVEGLRRMGSSVAVQKNYCGDIKCRRVITL